MTTAGGLPLAFLVGLLFLSCFARSASSLNTQPFAHPQWTEHARGDEELPADELAFIVALHLPKSDELREHFLRVSNPRHTDYGRYLNLDELRDRYGPSKQVTDKVVAHFATAIAGATVSASLSGDMIRVQATASAIEQGLSTKLRWFKRPSEAGAGKSVLRAVEPLSLPESVAQHVAFVSLNSHVSVPSVHQRRPHHDDAVVDSLSLAAAGVAGVSRGNEEALLSFRAFCADNSANVQNPPCPDDDLTLQVEVAAHANDRSAPYELIQAPLSFELPFASLWCLDATTSEPCQTGSTQPGNCVCYAKIAPLPKYVQLRAHLTVVDASGQQTFTNVTSTALFALTDVATVRFLADLYNMPRGLRVPSDSDSTQSVAEFYGEFYSNDDLAAFLRLSGLATASIPDSHVFGDLANNQSTPGGEAQLDVEYMMGLAPGARTYFYSIGDLNPYDSSNEGFLSYLFVVGNQTSPPLVHSLSYGDVEGVVFNQSIPGAADYASRCDQEFMKMGLRGLTVVFSSGDDGSASFMIRTDPEQACSQAWPSWPASSPYVTTVGATQLSKGYSPVCQTQFASVLPTNVALDVQCTDVAEVVCTSTLGGVITSGGGFSDVYDRTDVPWQEEVVQNYLAIAPDLPPSSFFNPNGRAYPDVTAYGSNYFVYLDGRIIRESGTSASTPVFGAMVTQWNHLRMANGQPALGFIAPLLYSLAQTNPEAFNDVTTGDIACGVGYSMETVPCCTHSFQATAGWDPTSGLGSPNFQTIAQLILEDQSGSDDDDDHETAALALSIIGIVLSIFCLLLTAYLFKTRSQSDYQHP